MSLRLVRGTEIPKREPATTLEYGDAYGTLKQAIRQAESKSGCREQHFWDALWTITGNKPDYIGVF